MSDNYLEEERVSHLMKRYALPCVISLVVGALYDIVDQIFIANASYLGSFGNAANTVVFPLTVVALGIAVMIGDGCCAFVSISLGLGEHDKASHSVGNAIVLSIISSLLITAIYLICSDAILAFFGGHVNEETFRLSKEYFFYITLGIPFYVFGQAMNPVIRSDGSPLFAMVSTLAGAAVNIILDPIFIFAFHWGMMGAAVATVAGQIVTAILSAVRISKMKNISLSRASFKLSFPICTRFLSLGLTSFLAQISLVAAMAAINSMLNKYSRLDQVFSDPSLSQIPMAVVGIVMKFFQIVISISVGLAAGCIPIAGYNLGKGRNDRVRKLFEYLLIAETVLGIIALFIVEFCPRTLIAIFGASGESIHYTEFGVRAFRIFLSMIIFACINKATFIYLQAIGRAFLSTMLSVTREIVFGVGFAIILPIFFGLDGVLYSMPVSDVITFILSVAVIVYIFHMLEKNDQR